MNDTDLGQAYRRLADAVTPPLDASDLVAARVAQRHRRRVSGYAALAVGLVLAAGGVAAGVSGGPEAGQDPVDRPSSSPSPSASDGVTCPDGAEPRTADLDHPGYRTFTALLAEQSDAHGAYLVDRRARRFSYVRDDGSVHTTVTWRRGQGRWFPDRSTTCPDAGEWRDVDPASVGPSGPMQLEVNACFVDTVDFLDKTWAVIGADQFDELRQPEGFTGSGIAWAAGDVVTYRDDLGALLTLAIAGDPWTKDFFC